MLDIGKAFHHSQDIGLIIDPEGRVTSASRGAESALGYGSGGLASMPFASLLDAANPFAGNGDLAKARLFRDLPLKTQAGRLLTFNAVAFPIGLQGWFLCEQELHRSVSGARAVGTPLDLLFGSIGAALWSFDTEGTVITWNRTSEAYFAHSRAGQFSPAAVFTRLDELRKVCGGVDAKGSFAGEVTLVARDDVSRTNLVQVTALVSADGGPIGYACLSYDPKDDSRVDPLQRALSDRLGDATLMIDPEAGAILDGNDRACALLALRREQLTRLRLAEILQGRTAETEAELAKSLQAESKSSRHESLRRSDGSHFPCSLVFMPTQLGRSRFVLATMLDLSSQARTDENVRKTREASDKKAASLEKAKSLLEAEVEELRGRVRQLEIGEGAPARRGRTADVGKCLEQAIALFEKESGVPVKKQVKAMPPVECMPEVLSEVLIGSFRNAGKGAGKKGITVKAKEAGGRVVLEIVDPSGRLGPGILEKLFEPVSAGVAVDVNVSVAAGGAGKISFRKKGGKAVCQIELPAAP